MLLRKPKSLGRYDTFSAVITNQRFIVAQMTADMMKEAATRAKEQAKAEGKGFLGQWSDQLKATSNFSRRYYEMSPPDILSETQGNFAIPNGTIEEVRLKLKDLGRQTNRREFEIEVRSKSGKYEFRMDENNDYIDMLKQTYGERLKMPFGYIRSGGLRFKLG